MSSISELARIAKQMEEMRSRLLGPMDQIRRQMSAVDAQTSLLKSAEYRIGATAAFSAIREQAALRESMMSGTGFGLSALARPAYEASRSIASMLDSTAAGGSVASFLAQAETSRQSSMLKVNARSEWLGALSAANTFHA